MMIIHYEVYVLESRGWMLHARFPRQERDNALAEAKELEQISLKVRVVRETYYSDTNTFDESDIYSTGKGPPDKSKAAAAPVAAARPAAGRHPPPVRSTAAAAHKPAAERPHKAPPPPPDPDVGMGRVISRLLAITALALALAMLAVKITPNAIMLLWHLGLQSDIKPDTYGTLLFSVFVLTFLMVAVPMALRFLPRQANITLPANQRRDTAAAGTAAGERARRVKKSLNKLANKAVAEGFAAEEDLDNPLWPPAPAPVLPEIGPDPEPEPELPDIRPEPEPELPEIHPDPEPRPAADPRPEPAEPAVPPTGLAESNRSAMMRFLGGAVDAVKRTAAVLDNYNKFALNLYLAGGVESLCDTRGLGETDRRQLTATMLETLGTGGDLARRFHDKLPEYLLEPRYLQVLQAGRNAMDEFLAGHDGNAHGELASVIKDWNRPTEKKKVSIVTVMFTDMVGSTDMTQAKGDAAAQEVVRRHNAIVRTAIAQTGGNEVKLTGDGIMASFPSAAGAVEAAVSIQRHVAAHNTSTPEQELHLRIGLNAGEPIQEEDDLFGTTVQIAARVCAATATDQILCTTVVKDLSLGKGGTFAPAGDHALKGFRDKMPLFEVLWRG